MLSNRKPSSVNVAWPHGGMGDAEYLYAFQRIIMPIAMEFSPDLVISKSI
jgi:histone deacetylase 6